MRSCVDVFFIKGIDNFSVESKYAKCVGNVQGQCVVFVGDMRRSRIFDLAKRSHADQDVFLEQTEFDVEISGFREDDSYGNDIM